MKAVVDEDFVDISLSDYAEKWVVLFFYPLDFTFVCPTEIIAFSEAAAKFKEINCEVLGKILKIKNISGLFWDRLYYKTYICMHNSTSIKN